MALACLVLGVSVLFIYIAHFELRPHVLEVYFFHLDRGRSIFIKTPNNQTILIDGGQNSQILREITKAFPFYRRRIDTVIVTSPEAKNAGGLSEVMSRYDIGRVIEPTTMGTSSALLAFEKEVRKKRIKIEQVEKGDQFEIDGIKFNILFPDSIFRFNKTSKPEMVIHLSFASTSALFLGDVSKTIQKSFVSLVEHINLVEYAHSASDSRVSPDLFDKIDPDFVVINKKATGRAPSKTKKKFDIENIKNQKINLDEIGTVRFVSDGEGFVVK